MLVGGLMAVPAIVAALYQEWHTLVALLGGSAITAVVGGALYIGFRHAPDPKRRHAMVIAGGGWLMVALFGAIPYLLAAYITPEPVVASYVPAGAGYASSLHAFRDPVHAIFESMSGYTTTGLTMTVHEPSLSHGLLFYRSFSQWIGGVGVIVLALAILRQAATVGGYSLFTSEGRERRVRPSAIGTARAIWRVYLGVTLLVAAYLATSLFLLQPGYGLEQTLFDAVNHAMTGQATGGFSVLDESIDSYGSYALELAHLPPMVLGAIAFPVYYRVWRNRDLGELTDDPQVKALFGLLVVGIPATAWLLSRATFPVPELGDGLVDAAGTLGASTAVREGLFQFTSALTGTGWQTSTIGSWDAAPLVFVVFFAANVGGCAGATTGGFKLIRALLVAKGIRWEATRAFLPEDAVQTIEIGGRTLQLEEINEEMRRAGLMILAYLLVLLLATILLLPILEGDGTTASHVVFEVASAQGTVGLSTGITGPSMPKAAEIGFIGLMWLGRLEIFPVLAFLRALVHGVKFR